MKNADYIYIYICILGWKVIRFLPNIYLWGYFSIYIYIFSQFSTSMWVVSHTLHVYYIYVDYFNKNKMY